jgi:hypothetical protein
LKELIAKETSQSERKIKEIQDKVSTPEAKIGTLKNKVRDLTSILKTWK